MTRPIASSRSDRERERNRESTAMPRATTLSSPRSSSTMRSTDVDRSSRLVVNSNGQAQVHVQVSQQQQQQHQHRQSQSQQQPQQQKGRKFPNPVAVFNDQFIFTSLDKVDAARHVRMAYVHPDTGKGCCLFSLDDQVAYTPFAKDHGPLNMAHTLQSFLAIHEIVHDDELKGRPVCLYTSTEPKMKSNMTLLVAMYFLIVANLDPSTCFMPIANFEVMPFRDAGNGHFDHGLSIQDCLYGMHKALYHGLLDIEGFDAAQYQHYEQPINGDLNFLGPFIPFASPMEINWLRSMMPRWKAAKEAAASGQVAPPMRPTMKGRLTGNDAFKQVLQVFEKHEVGVVVRLNDELYDKRHFTDIGIDHVEMYFDDGSNPSDDIVRDFIDLAEGYITEGKMVAVHCKAGLGRTGCLIGAYLIYKYHFTAQEVIGFMRIVQPGMVVGPQQQYMMANQMKWVGWAAVDSMKREHNATRHRQPATPPADVDIPLPTPGSSPRRISVIDVDMDRDVAAKHGDAVGQPRKGPKGYGSVELRSPTPELTPDRELAPPGTPQSVSTSITGSASSMRGTKRGASRSPRSAIPTTLRSSGHSHSQPSEPPSAFAYGSQSESQSQAQSRNGLDIPVRTSAAASAQVSSDAKSDTSSTTYLERSPSLASVASANDRPRKRIHGSPSPLSNLASTSENEEPPHDGSGRGNHRLQAKPSNRRLVPKSDARVAQTQLAVEAPSASQKQTVGYRSGSGNGGGITVSTTTRQSSTTISRDMLSSSPPSRIPISTAPRRIGSPLREINTVPQPPNAADSPTAAGPGSVSAPSRIPRLAPSSPVPPHLKTPGKDVKGATSHTSNQAHPAPVATPSRRMGLSGVFTPPRLAGMFGLGRAQPVQAQTQA